MKVACLLAFLFVFVISNGQDHGRLPRLLGAELLAEVSKPGKLKIILQKFYNASEAVAETETVVMFGNDSIPRAVELKIESDFIDVNYSPVGNWNNRPVPAARAVIYSAVTDVNSKNVYTVGWSYSDPSLPLNNVMMIPGEAMALKVTVSDISVTGSAHPLLKRLPVLQVDAGTANNYPLLLSDRGNGTDAQMEFVAPLVVSGEKSAVNIKTFREASFIMGYSSTMPARENMTWKRDISQLQIDRPARGNYLLSFSISRLEEKQKHNHQVIFIIQSI